jgi:hypothetical protein
MSLHLSRCLAAALGSFVLAIACGSPDESDNGAMMCEHGTYSDCVCSDGSMGTQLCAHDTSGFEPCQCGGDTDGTSDPTTDPSTTSPTTSASTSMGTTDPTTTTSTSATEESSGGESSSGVDEGSSSSAGPIGSAPVADIFHPSDGEERVAGDDIPWIGSGDDAEDGALTGMALVWTSDVDGELGNGEMLNAPLTTVGMHTITLTATDSDGNTGEASITIDVVAP